MLFKYCFLSWLIFTHLSCESPKLVKERFILSMPVIRLDSSIENFRTDFAIITYDNITMYELPFRESFSRNDSLISDTFSYEYFIFNTNNKWGYLVRSFKDSFKNKIEKSPFLLERAYYGYTFDSTLNLRNPHTVVAETGDKFYIKYPSPNPSVDSVIGYFDATRKNMKYALAPNLDSTFRSKLYKVVFWQNAKAILNKDKAPAPLIVTFEMKPEVIKNSTQIHRFFDRFIKSEEGSSKDSILH